MQNAILNVQKQQAGNLTIIMIAHRLQTIMTADNLLYLESPTNVIAASKGTPEYQQLIDRLMQTNYAHQADQIKEGEAEDSLESDDDMQEDETANDNAHDVSASKALIQKQLTK